MDFETIRPFEGASVMAWELRCVRCDGILVGTRAEGLCTLCEQGPALPLWEAPSMQGTPETWATRIAEADEIVVAALMVGHRFEGRLLAERCAAAMELLRRRPDLERGEIAETVGLNVRTVTRMLHHLYQKQQRRPSREDVIEKLMTGKTNRITPTSDERREAIRRLIRQGGGDAAISKIVGEKVSVVAGHRHRMKAVEADVDSGRSPEWLARRDAALEVMRANPELSLRQVADRTGVSVRTLERYA